MTLVESLKKFLTKLGGNPNELENNATSAEVIDAISEAYTDKEGTYTEVTPIGNSGTKIATITTNNTAHDIYAPKELPAVTSADEGDVLGVNSNGEWVKTTPSGGSDIFEINVAMNPSSSQVDKHYHLLCDINNFNDIVAAHDAGKTIYLNIDFDGYEDVGADDPNIYRAFHIEKAFHVPLDHAYWHDGDIEAFYFQLSQFDYFDSTTILASMIFCIEVDWSDVSCNAWFDWFRTDMYTNPDT